MSTSGQQRAGYNSQNSTLLQTSDIGSDTKQQYPYNCNAPFPPIPVRYNREEQGSDYTAGLEDAVCRGDQVCAVAFRGEGEVGYE